MTFYRKQCQKSAKIRISFHVKEYSNWTSGMFRFGLKNDSTQRWYTTLNCISLAHPQFLIYSNQQYTSIWQFWMLRSLNSLNTFFKLVWLSTDKMIEWQLSLNVTTAIRGGLVASSSKQYLVNVWLWNYNLVGRMQANDVHLCLSASKGAEMATFTRRDDWQRNGTASVTVWRNTHLRCGTDNAMGLVIQGNSVHLCLCARQEARLATFFGCDDCQWNKTATLICYRNNILNRCQFNELKL